MILSKVSLDSLLHENLFPPRAAGGRAATPCFAASAPMTAGSFVELAGRLVLYAGGAGRAAGARLVPSPRVAGCDGRGGRRRWAWRCWRWWFAPSSCAATWTWPTPGSPPGRPWPRWRSSGVPAAAAAPGRRPTRSPCSARASSPCSPPRPMRPSSRSPTRRSPSSRATRCPSPPCSSSGCTPRLLARGDRTAAAVGLAWVAVLAVAGWVLVAHDARDESFTVSGPGGSMTASAAAGPAYQEAVDRILAAQPPGRPDPAGAADERALHPHRPHRPACPTSPCFPGWWPRRPRSGTRSPPCSDVRIAVTDRRPLTEYGRGRLRHRLQPAHRRLAAERLPPRDHSSGRQGRCPDTRRLAKEHTMKLPSTIGITGAAGFVGANLSERLLAEGCAVDRRGRHVRRQHEQRRAVPGPPELRAAPSSTAGT